jgi:hypothetical protein
MNEIGVLWLGEGWNGLEKHDYVSLPVSEDNVEISYRTREQRDFVLSLGMMQLLKTLISYACQCRPYRI